MLNEKQAAILKLRSAGLTYKEIALSFGLSVTRVRQIHLKSLLLEQDNIASKWTHGLPKKIANVLVGEGYKNKESVMEALASGELTKVVSFGHKSIELIKAWAVSQLNP
jgi:transcriptional regulator